MTGSAPNAFARRWTVLLMTIDVCNARVSRCYLLLLLYYSYFMTPITSRSPIIAFTPMKVHSPLLFCARHHHPLSEPPQAMTSEIVLLLLPQYSYHWTTEPKQWHHHQIYQNKWNFLAERKDSLCIVRINRGAESMYQNNCGRRARARDCKVRIWKMKRFQLSQGCMFMVSMIATTELTNTFFIFFVSASIILPSSSIHDGNGG
jgi:hypothetical protein